MRAVCVVIAGLAACVLAIRDVPKGHCHNCEVTCFEDCVVKFDREIVQPDLSGKDRLSRKETRVEGAMKKKLHGIVLSQNATSAALKDSYSTCLTQEKCPCPHQDTKKKSPSFLQAQGGKCKISERPCAVGCVNKTVAGSPALLQTVAVVKPGPKDPDDAAIPWSVNIHPVKINTFATGRQNLEQCMKSCLAATCGCDDAPGMEAIDDLGSAIKQNDAAKEAVDDSNPSWQYKEADIVTCAKGMPGKKVTKGLYTSIGGGDLGWKEVCSDGFFEALGKSPDVEKKNCANKKSPLAGCIWDKTKVKCVYGMKKMMGCNIRYKDDDKF